MSEPTSGTPPAAPAASPSDPSSTTTPAAQLPHYGTHPVIHNAALVLCGVAAVGLLMPPRRMDVRNAILSVTFFYSSDQLVHDFTGQGIQDRFQKRISPVTDSVTTFNDLPEGAKRAQAAMQAERQRRIAAGEEAAEDKGRRKTDWRKEWDEAEKKAFSEGKGYGSLIMDAVRDVVGIKKKDDDDQPPPKSDGGSGSGGKTPGGEDGKKS